MLKKFVVLLVVALGLAPVTHAQEVAYDSCGTLVRQNACVLFAGDNGIVVKILYPAHYRIGDRFHVSGFINPYCMAPCPMSRGCIYDLSIRECEPPPPPCPVDFNASGTVTVQDIFDFLSAYFLNDIAADYNESASVTVQDIFDFLSAYFIGCP